MRILLVTSQITYVPKNCYDFFEKLLENNSHNIAGLVMLQNLSGDMVFKIMWLYKIGCMNLANTLLQNVLEIPRKKREILFKKNNLPVFKIKNINDSRTIKWVRDNNIDLIINFRTRNIYKKEILAAPRLGCVNIHHGILPKYRGIFCDLYALYENRPAGISLHRMSELIDDGKILFRKQISYKNEHNYVDYLSRIWIEEVGLITKLINHIKKNGNIPNGVKNYSKQAIFTKTPNAQEVRMMKRGDLIL